MSDNKLIRFQVPLNDLDPHDVHDALQALRNAAKDPMNRRASPRAQDRRTTTAEPQPSLRSSDETIK